MENGKEFLSVRRRYGDNVDCEEFRIHFSLSLSSLRIPQSRIFIVAWHPYDLNPFAKINILFYL